MRVLQKQLVKSMNSLCNSLELALAVANTNWHFQQIYETAEDMRQLLIELTLQSELSQDGQKVKSRLSELARQALKRQKLPTDNGR